MASPEFSRSGIDATKESQNPAVDTAAELANIQEQLGQIAPKSAEAISAKLDRLSPGELAQALPQIRNELLVLRGNQDSVRRQERMEQVNLLSGQEDLPDFSLA